MKNDDSKNVSKSISVVSANGENVPNSTEPDESKTIGEGSASSGLTQGDSGFKSEGIVNLGRFYVTVFDQ